MWQGGRRSEELVAGPREGTERHHLGSGGKFREPTCQCPRATSNGGPRRALGNQRALWGNLPRPRAEPHTQSRLCFLDTTLRASDTAPMPCSPAGPKQASPGSSSAGHCAAFPRHLRQEPGNGRRVSFVGPKGMEGRGVMGTWGRVARREMGADGHKTPAQLRPHPGHSPSEPASHPGPWSPGMSRMPRALTSHLAREEAYPEKEAAHRNLCSWEN